MKIDKSHYLRQVMQMISMKKSYLYFLLLIFPTVGFTDICRKDNVVSCEITSLCVEAMKAAPQGNWGWRNRNDDFVREADRRNLECPAILGTDQVASERLKLRCQMLDELEETEEKLERIYSKLEDLRRDAEESKDAVRDAALGATIIECYDWVAADRRAALTNPICSKIILENGLSITGSSFNQWGEIAALEQEARYNRAMIENTRMYLEALVEKNMLPQEWRDFLEKGKEKPFEFESPKWLLRPLACG